LTGFQGTPAHRISTLYEGAGRETEIEGCTSRAFILGWAFMAALSKLV